MQGQLDESFKGMIGESGAKALQDMIAGASRKDEGTIATVLGVAMLLLGASGVFGELQSSLNTIWEVEPKPGRGFWGVIRDRFFSMTMVLGTAFLLLASLLVSTALAAAGKFFSESLPGSEVLWSVVNGVVSFGITTLLFALIFKYVPDVKIAWNDVWIGALVTAGLFVLGKALIGMYLGRSSSEFDLRRGRIARDCAALDLLRLADIFLRRRVHSSLRQFVWVTRCSRRGCRSSH